MKLQSLVITSAVALGLIVPSSAQMQSAHRYLFLFKYSDSAMKAMMENPQDRGAQGIKLAESFGGKMETSYWFPMGGEWDGFNVTTYPDDVTVEASTMYVRSSGNIVKVQSIPLMTSDEFKAAMEKAKNVKSNWTPPTTTKQ